MIHCMGESAGSSSWVPFFNTVGPWCLSSSLSFALGLAYCGCSCHRRRGVLGPFLVVFWCSSSPLSTKPLLPRAENKKRHIPFEGEEMGGSHIPFEGRR